MRACLLGQSADYYITLMRPANDRWHEFSLPTNATFGQLKVTVLRHWKIIPEVFVPSVSQARGDGSTCPASSARQPLSAVQTSAQRSRKAPDTSHGNPPAGSNKEVITSMKSADDKRRTSWGSSIDRTQAIPSKSYSAPIDAIRECALILTSYSFRSVCSGCFLPDEAVLSKRCVENDLLVVSVSPICERPFVNKDFA